MTPPRSPGPLRCLGHGLALCLLVLATLTQAQDPPPAQGQGLTQDAAHADAVSARLDAERQRLQQQRDAIEADHEARMRACWQRFAVNDCLRQARRSRHAALDPIRQQELQLNAQERAWRTLQRDERLQLKQDNAERQP